VTKTFLKLSLMVCAICVIQCARHRPTDPLLGGYDIVAADNTGKRVFTGTMSLTSRDANGATGRCTITRESTAPVGVVDQSAPCLAVLEGQEITIDLAPSLDDGGLILQGRIDGGRMSGEWGFKSVVGHLWDGKFEATKKR
jgi:hypothetical protein